MYILAWLSRHNVIMPINMGTLLQLSPVSQLGRNLAGLFWLAKQLWVWHMPVYAVLWYYSDVLFDAKCDTDNAGELLETPTKLGCRILTENKGNPAPTNSRTYTGWKNRLKTTPRRRAANFSNKLYKCVWRLKSNFLSHEIFVIDCKTCHIF